MTAEEYEIAFHGIDLPPTLELATGVVVSDVAAFVEKSLHILRTSTSKRVVEMVMYRLDRALELLGQSPAL
jgi:hypothetical protein